jgi:small subunit ribosomal protein S18
MLAERGARRSNQRSTAKGGREVGGKRFTPHRKVCGFCADKITYIDYKDIGRLRRYISDRGKIEPRRKMGTCSRHQRRLAIALKRARFLALLPYTPEHVRNLAALSEV